MTKLPCGALLYIVRAVEGHDHAVHQRFYRFRNQCLMALGDDGDVLADHGSQSGSAYIGAVDDGLCLKVTLWWFLRLRSGRLRCEVL